MRLATSMRTFMAGVAVLSIAALPQEAKAQGLFDMLLGPGPNSSGMQVIPFYAKAEPGTIVVSFADRRLYYVLRDNKAISYPVGAPTGEARWSGVTHISAKRVNPPWTPTPEMRRENPKLPAYVPGGHPMNPLGMRALYLGDTLYRIHGTDAPWTIGSEVSKGCIRMYNRDVIDLYDRVKVGTKVVVTWKRYLQ